MKSPKVCPHCGSYIEALTYNNEWIHFTYIDSIEAKCLGCNRKYTWKEIYPLQAIEDFEEYSPTES